MNGKIMFIFGWLEKIILPIKIFLQASYWAGVVFGLYSKVKTA